MPHRKRVLNKETPPLGYEMTIDEAWLGIANLYDAIEIAEQGYRADFLELNQTTVVIKAKRAGENPDAVVTVCPDCTFRVPQHHPSCLCGACSKVPDLKLVED